MSASLHKFYFKNYSMQKLNLYLMRKTSIKLMLSLLLTCMVVISCNKESDKPSSPSSSHKGQVTFYNLENNCSSVKIVCENQNGTITKQYYPDSVECNGEGTFTLTLDTGVHKFTATCANLTVEKEFTIKENECIKQGVGWYLDPAMTAGIWTMDFALGAGDCDETDLEDERGIPPTFHFNSGTTITFNTHADGAATVADLNDSTIYNNTYFFREGLLHIIVAYDGNSLGYNEQAETECILQYDAGSKTYSGTYEYKYWGYGEPTLTCSNSVKLYH